MGFLSKLVGTIGSNKSYGGTLMFKNVLRKLVWFGLVLCVVGSVAFAEPTTATNGGACVEPFTIYVGGPSDDD